MRVPTNRPLPAAGGFLFLVPLLFAAHGGVYTPPAPSTGVPLPSGPPGANLPGAPPMGPKTPGLGGAAPSTGQIALAQTSTSWWAWWERNRFDYLVPVRVREDLPRTGSGDVLPYLTAQRLAQALAGRRAELLSQRVRPHLEKRFRDPDHNLRASALLSSAKLDGAASVAPLRAALRDAHAVVRDGAILGLGASATEEGAKLLAAIAADEKEGRLALGEGGSIVERTRAMALLALGVSRARGGPDLATAAARAALAERRGGANLDRGVGACLALALSEDEGAVPDLLRAAADRDQPVPVRCRALSAIGSIGTASARPLVEGLLADRDRLVRGAAAIALGDLVRPGDAEAAQRLLAFLEKESDIDVAGFALISLGKAGGSAATKALARELVRGKDARKPFAAISLALAARDAADGSAAERLREAFRLDRSPDRRGAYAMALGILGDRAEAGAVGKAYRDAASLSQRVELSEALALFRAGEGREALLGMLAGDRSNVGRSQAAFALGFYCDPRDVRVLADALRKNAASTLMGPYSLGLGIHGSEGAVEELLRVLEAGKTEPVASAAALDALAVALQDDPIPTLHRVARGSNYFADPPFVFEALEFLL